MKGGVCPHRKRRFVVRAEQTSGLFCRVFVSRSCEPVDDEGTLMASVVRVLLLTLGYKGTKGQGQSG